MLLPFFPRKPHRLDELMSVAASLEVFSLEPLRALLRPGVGGPSWTRFGLPPRIADTDECCDRADFCMEDVIAMHSDQTRETGSTATDTGCRRYCMRQVDVGARRGLTAVETGAALDGIFVRLSALRLMPQRV
jgi:hypothetical protein